MTHLIKMWQKGALYLIYLLIMFNLPEKILILPGFDLDQFNKVLIIVNYKWTDINILTGRIRVSDWQLILFQFKHLQQKIYY